MVSCELTLDANSLISSYPCGLHVMLRIFHEFGQEAVAAAHEYHHAENHDHGEKWQFIVHREMVDSPILLCADFWRDEIKC